MDQLPREQNGDATKPWLVPKMGDKQVTAALSGADDGTFVVREHKRPEYILSVVEGGKVKHHKLRAPEAFGSRAAIPKLHLDLQVRGLVDAITKLREHHRPSWKIPLGEHWAQKLV